MEHATKPDTVENPYLGTLPCRAPLATPYVPYQKNDPQKYDAAKGLARGTLFPGLDLPYLGMVNSDSSAVTPLKELMAMSFAITELGLYLDTHSDDTEALSLFRSYVEMYESAMKSFEAQYGPLELTCAGQNGVYNWTQDPWPWDYTQAGDTVQAAKITRSAKCGKEA